MKLSAKYNRKKYPKMEFGGDYMDSWETDPEDPLLRRPGIRFNNQLMPNRAPRIPSASLSKPVSSVPVQDGAKVAGDAAKGAGLTSAVGAFAPMAASLVDAIDSGNEYGRQKRGSVIGKGALTGAAAGATLGPIGAAAGAVLGAATGFIQSGKQKKAENIMINDKKIRDKRMESDYSAAQMAANPSLYQGYMNSDYFRYGGKIRKENPPIEMMEQIAKNGYAMGGTLKPLSSDGSEVIGRSHEAGGVKLAGLGVELEGNETTKGDYVFSDELGFAKLHKPIMRAKGKIEAKPFTRERNNSIKLLNEQENRLKVSQEYIKKLRGIT